MTDPAYFERMYAGATDPWHLEGSDYERRKYDLTVASLPRDRYARAFEPGCSVGLLTARLATRCDVLLASDVSPVAVATTRDRVAAMPGPVDVAVEVGAVPASWPAGTFDLVVVSELLYFLGPDDRDGVRAAARRSLAPGGDLVLVHWRHPFDEAASDGDAVHAEYLALADATGVAGGWDTVVHHLEEDFVLDVLRPVT